MKKRTRKTRKVGRPNVKLYFHEGTHNAIVDYQKSDDLKEKEKIYVSDILPAFEKLAENLIFMHGFHKAFGAGSYGDLKNDCVTFLYETLHKFDPSRGSKAFSYFNVVAKNWLIIKSKQKTRQNRRKISIDDKAALSSSDTATIEFC